MKEYLSQKKIKIENDAQSAGSKAHRFIVYQVQLLHFQNQLPHQSTFEFASHPIQSCYEIFKFGWFMLTTYATLNSEKQTKVLISPHT